MVLIRGLTARCALAAAVCAASLVIGACGSAASSSTATSSSAGQTAPPAATSPATPTSATSTAQPSVTSTVSAQARGAAAGCGPAQIAVSVGASVGGLGHVGAPLLFRNTGSASCVLTGYPGVALVRATRGGQTQATRTPTGYLGGLTAGSGIPPVVRLRPGQTVSALLEGSDVSAGGAACPGYASLLVTPPNQTVTVRFSRAWPGLCRPEIHPVVTGTTGRQR